MPSLLISCPSSWGLRQAETATWLEGLFYHLGQGIEIPFGSVARAPVKGRIETMRNQAVAAARRGGFSHLLLVDPDMIPDRYVGRDPRAVRWWPAAWSWMQEHPGSVIGVAARGQSPENPVQVWRRDPDGRLRRMTAEHAIQCEGWHRVGAVGSGMLLIDMAVFDRLSKPYFADSFWDGEQASLLFSQDMNFCRNCNDHNVPLWVNFSCWCGHVQPEIVEKPYWDSLSMRSLVEVVPDDATVSEADGQRAPRRPGTGGPILADEDFPGPASRPSTGEDAPGVPPGTEEHRQAPVRRAARWEDQEAVQPA